MVKRKEFKGMVMRSYEKFLIMPNEIFDTTLHVVPQKVVTDKKAYQNLSFEYSLTSYKRTLCKISDHC